MKQDVCTEGLCDGSGFLFDAEARRAKPCKCRPRRLATRKAKKLANVIPPRYLGVSFDRPPVSEMNPHVVSVVREYVDQLEENLSTGRGIWFYGEVGTGKTTLAMLVSSTALRREFSVAIYSLPRLLGMLRQSFDSGSESSLAQLLDRLAAVDLLHVDDVGAQQTSPWVLEQLYTIINTRYEEERSVVVTTNLDLDGLRDEIGPRTVSRLVEMCGEPVPLFGRDHRMEAGLESSSPPSAANDSTGPPLTPQWGLGDR